MKPILVTLFIALSTITYSQTKKEVQAQLEGYKTNDTVRFDDFISNGKLVVNSSEYRVVGFTFMVWAGIVQEFKSDSCTITDEMRAILRELKLKGFKTSKIYFHSIKIRNDKGEQGTTGDIIYRLKLN
jgi:hypothetical protein